MKFDGRSKMPEYVAWCSMKSRCLETYKRRQDYYDRGITVCAEWLGDGGYERFLEHVGRRPSEEHTLDRIDNDKGYEPGNVRWSTRKEQQRNRRNNIYVEHGGRRRLLAEVCDELGVNLVVVRGRLVDGWSLEDAISTPVKDKPRGWHWGDARPIAVKCARCGKEFERSASLERRRVEQGTDGPFCGYKCSAAHRIEKRTGQPYQGRPPRFRGLGDEGLRAFIAEHSARDGGCAVWTGSKREVYVRGQRFGVQELALLLRVPAETVEWYLSSRRRGMRVRSTCGNQGCVEPSHLVPFLVRRVGGMKTMKVPS